MSARTAGKGLAAGSKPQPSAAVGEHLTCLLDEQPGYLVPRGPNPLSPRTSRRDGLIVNPLCRFFWHSADNSVESPGKHRASIWVVDPVTGLGSVFTVASVLGPVLRQLQPGDPAPRTIPAAHAGVLLRAGILISPTEVKARRRMWSERQSRLRRQFERHGYVRLPGLLHPFCLGELRLHYRRLIRTGGMQFGDPQTSGRYAAHNENAARSVHRQLTDLISNLAGEPVKPSYAYVVSYQGGAKLTEHVDREQCEFSVSLLLDYTPDCLGPSPWPLCLRAGRVVRISQRIGEALLYRGRSLPHFRNRLADHATSTLMLLHYVPRDFAGPLD